ncbi:MAG: hypothetical protein L7U72_07440 [Rubripirellula sp.]|nr:hypothetical protein [Rubripirellula sp.]
MSHLQSFGDASAMMGQRTDQLISNASDPLPWIIRRLVREQGKQTEKCSTPDLQRRVSSPEQ